MKWIDNIKVDVKLMELSIGEPVNLTRDIEKWRSLVASWQPHRQPTADGREERDYCSHSLPNTLYYTVLCDVSRGLEKDIPRR